MPPLPTGRARRSPALHPACSCRLLPRCAAGARGRRHLGHRALSGLSGRGPSLPRRPQPCIVSGLRSPGLAEGCMFAGDPGVPITRRRRSPLGLFLPRLTKSSSAQLLALLMFSRFRGSLGMKEILWVALRIIHLANTPEAPLRLRAGLDALSQAPALQSPAPIVDITATNNFRQGDSPAISEREMPHI